MGKQCGSESYSVDSVIRVQFHGTGYTLTRVAGRVRGWHPSLVGNPRTEAEFELPGEHVKRKVSWSSGSGTPEDSSGQAGIWGSSAFPQLGMPLAHTVR